MDRPRVKVAVVRSDNRRGAVAQALALIAPDLRTAISPDVLVKPNLASRKRQLPSTHADALSAALDAAFAAGALRATIAEGASDAQAGFERFGYRRECGGRPVAFLDIDRDESEWVPLELSGTDGTRRMARVSRTVAESRCRVSLAPAKTHETSIVAFSLQNMLSSIHPDDRASMPGANGGGDRSAARRRGVEFLRGDSLAAHFLTRALGRARNARNRLSAARSETRGSLSEKDLAYLRSVEAMNRNLVALSRVAKPHVSVVDGFAAMHREGPRHGTPLKLGVVIAGTDAVAVDAVAARVLGFDPLGIGYLAYAEAVGLGTTDADAIEIVGDPVAKVARRAVPHSNHAIARRWDRLAILKGPHAPVRSNAEAR